MSGASTASSGAEYSAISTSRARSSSTPITTRSGWRKSRMATPSRRNSGLDATEKLPRRRTVAMIFSTASPVPTGTVDFTTTTAFSARRGAISLAAM
jgi:hypothetical protein